MQGQMSTENAMRILDALKEAEKDLQDLPKDIVESIKVILVETMDEVLELALERLPVSQGQAGIHSQGGKQRITFETMSFQLAFQ